MTIEQDREQEIRIFFEQVHRDSDPPPFRALWGKATAPRPPRAGWPPVLRLAAVGSVLVAILAVGLTSRSWRSPEAPPIESVASDPLTTGGPAWQGPLDFLLDIPGRELLAVSSPRIPGAIPDFTTEFHSLPSLPERSTKHEEC